MAILVAGLVIPSSVHAALPELPRAFIDTTYVRPTGTTIAVAAGGDFQAALDAAQPGDVITLQAGATFTGPFVLPNKTGAGWITVRTSAPDRSLPPPGTRVNPSYAVVMPKIVVGEGVGGAIQTGPGAHHFRFIGVEIRPVPGAAVWALVELGHGSQTTATLPHDIVIDRCYIHGLPEQELIRGVSMNGQALAVIDSYLVDFKSDYFFPSSLAEVGFVDLAGGNYRLAATSPYRNAGTDGRDIGADIAAVALATAGAISGITPVIVSPPASPRAPVPILYVLVPSRATVGGATFILAVGGGRFVRGSTVLWNGVAGRPPT